MEIKKKQYDISQLAIKHDRYDTCCLLCSLLMVLLGGVIFYCTMVSREPYKKGQGELKGVVIHNNEVNVIVNNRLFIVVDYKNTNDFDKLSGKQVKIEWIARYGKTKKIGDFLISMKDIQGKPLPYNNPYYFQPFEYDKTLLFFSVVLFFMFLFGSVFFYLRKTQLLKEMQRE